MSKVNIYTLDVSVSGCATYQFDAYDEMDYWDDYLAHYFNGRPLSKDWKMPKYELGAPERPLHDFVHGEIVAPFVSERAKKVLEPLVGNAVQFWPIGKIKDQDYYILNVIHVINCLDLDQSKISYASDVPGKVLGISKAIFEPAKIPQDAVIFKVPQETGTIYVTDAFVDCVRKHRLTGVGFEYPHDVGVSKPKYVFPDLPIKEKKQKKRCSHGVKDIRGMVEKELSYYEGPGLQLCFNILEKLQGEKYKTNYQQKEIDMLKQVPKKLGYYYLIYRFDGLWGNGGMQAIVFDKEIEENKILLKKTAEAMDYYGFREKVKLIKELIPIAYEAQKQSDELLARDAGDEEFEPIWVKIDAFDPRYDSADEGRNMYQAILDDLKKSPKVASAENLREEIDDKIF